LTDTVEQLKTSVAETASDIRHRISPDAIKAEVSGYIKTRGEQLLNDLTAAARRNPMQAVAVGASVAYPLLRLVRTIPVPILMIGAGLFFARAKSGQTATQKASDVASDLSDEAIQRARQIGNQVAESASAAKDYASEQLDRASAAVSGAIDPASRAVDAAGATISSTSQKLQEKAASFGASVADRASDLKDSGIHMSSSATTAVQDAASGATSAGRRAMGAATDAATAAREKADDFTERTGKTIFQTIEQNPLLVAGVGLLVGGLIASALPRSEIEDDLVGDASNATKRRAQAATSQGFDAARTVAGEIYDETARQAEKEGLTPDGFGKAAQDITQRVRRVAEAAVTTAFEPSQDENQPSNALGGNDHD
jgi:hypothetical protein